MNYKFNIDEWLNLYPLKEKYGHYSAHGIGGPCSVCTVEQLRRETKDEIDWGPPVPVDIFIMADGEPVHRNNTKLGGLPYRPATATWPTNVDGTPQTFMAQFDFTDSLDITGELPGDVLLVFCDRSEGWFNSFYFEWRRLGLDDLVSARDIPRQEHSFAPSYGHCYRTLSFPHATQKRAGYPICRGMPVWSPYYLFQFQATQIGRSPFFIQHEDQDFPGQMLCTISSMFIPCEQNPYPWINRVDPLSDEEIRADNHLSIIDTGCVYISIDDNGDLHWRLSSY